MEPPQWCMHVAQAAFNLFSRVFRFHMDHSIACCMFEFVGKQHKNTFCLNSCCGQFDCSDCPETTCMSNTAKLNMFLGDFHLYIILFVCFLVDDRLISHCRQLSNVMINKNNKINKQRKKSPYFTKKYFITITTKIKE